MREEISIEVNVGARERLAAVVADRNSPQKRVWRAQIILGERRGLRHGRDHAPRRGLETQRVALAGAALREGVAGLLRDKTRKPGLPPLPRR